MRYFGGLACVFIVFQLSASSAVSASMPTATGTSPKVLEQSRKDYGKAIEAAQKGRWSDFDVLRSKLDSYPLAVYLDYQKLTRQPRRASSTEAGNFIQYSDDTPLANRYLNHYLRRAGSDRRWSDFLALRPTEPNTVALQCYYHRAKYNSGDKASAWLGASKLWVHGKSQPKECDPLFKAWIGAGQLTDELVWARLLAVFDARQRSLLGYVARHGSAQLKPRSEQLLAVYRKPGSLQSLTLDPTSPYATDIAAYGLAYLARYNPEKAQQQWLRFQQQLSFSEQQIHRVEHAIALRGLFAKTQSLTPWLHGALGRLGEDKLVEIRLRWALGEQDWVSIMSTLDLLTPERAGDGVWQYWRGKALEQAGQTEEAAKLYNQLAQERGYYSFLASDKVDMRYAFNDATFQPPAVAVEGFSVAANLSPLAVSQIPAVARIRELYQQEQARDAHSEWFKLLQNSPLASMETLASYASDQGWYRLAIDAANEAKAWGRLDLRFPMAYQDTFNKHASMQQLPSSELMAIARRESAFFPQVSSPVGARGLMQIMPATGKQVASRLGVKHRDSDLFEIDHNVHLGSAYYRRLLDRFSGNRVFALTAYNAGPHRVDRWRNKAADTVPFDIWIETIPYKETRNYVQAVLSYNVVFRYLSGNYYSLLTASELQDGY